MILHDKKHKEYSYNGFNYQHVREHKCVCCSKFKKYSESRIYGNNRYETSENIANNFNNNSNNKIKNIILASGENFPDALSGSSIAVKQNAVILLVNDKSASDLKKCLDCCSINNLTQLSHIKMMVEA